MNTSTISIGIEEFSDLIGSDHGDTLRELKGTQIDKNFPLRFRSLSVDERDDVLLRVIRAISDLTMPVAGRNMKDIWERCWEQQLANLTSDKTPEIIRQSLVPEYMKDSNILRLNGDYVSAETSNAELKFADLLRARLFGDYFTGLDWIGDFGAGSGLNVVYMADMFPGIALRGFDRSVHSVSIMNELGHLMQANIEGVSFDFTNPDGDLEIPANSGILTWGALEQVGSEFEPFVDWLLTKRPDICVHVEPIVEWYDRGHLVDNLAIKYHHKRGYLVGFWPALQQLAAEGKAEIIKAHRTTVGSLFHEVYSIVVWRPSGLA